jgi:hypothetical protein
MQKAAFGNIVSAVDARFLVPHIDGFCFPGYYPSSVVRLYCPGETNALYFIIATLADKTVM